MKSFRISNIKAFADSGNIELSPITIFVGQNSCGKSSLIRFPAVLSQTFLEDSESPICFFGKLLDYGNYEDVVHGHKDSSISYSIDYDIDFNTPFLFNSVLRRYGETRFYYNKPIIHKCQLCVTIDKKKGDDKRLIIKELMLLIDDTLTYSISFTEKKYTCLLNSIFTHNEFHRLASPLTISGRLQIDPYYDNLKIPIIEVYPQHIIDAVNRYPLSKDKPKIKKYGDYKRRPTYYRESTKDFNETDNFCLTIEKSIEYLKYITIQITRVMQSEAIRLNYIGPFRQNPDRYYRNMERTANTVGARGENVSTILINDFYKNKELIRKISMWLYDALGYKLAIKDMGSNLFQLMIEDNRGFQSNIMDVGYGISQVLPIVAATLQNSQPRTKDQFPYDNILIIEQPELHLHPSAQAELANLFAECILSDKIKNIKKLLIETHSEHLIRNLQVLIGNRTLTVDMVKIYSVEKDENGTATVKEMRINSNGKFIDKWPSGFFDKAQELSMELLRASAKRIGEE